MSNPQGANPQDITAAILAGGLGTRLRSVLGDLPKALAPVAGRPFLAYQLDWLKAQGICRVILCTGYRHDLIHARFADGAGHGLDIRYSIEERPLGTAGALLGARHMLKGTFLVVNGDTYFDADLPVLVAYHRTGHALATLSLVRVDHAGRFGAVSLDGKGNVTRFTEKRRSGASLINAGVYVCEPAIFEHLPGRVPLSLEAEVFPDLAASGVLRGCVLPGYHKDIGLPESYAQFQQDVVRLQIVKE